MLMRWVERGGFFFAGGLAVSGVYYAIGWVKLEGDLLANILGAAIGGIISIGAALLMFNHERRTTARDAEQAARAKFDAETEQALSFVTSIKARLESAKLMTVNTSGERIADLVKACDLAVRMQDSWATMDFALYSATTKAVAAGRRTVEQLNAALPGVQAAHGDDVILAAATFCDPSIGEVDQIQAAYRGQRVF